MSRGLANPRVPDQEIDPAFLDRWSPRAFAPTAVDPALLERCFEAARWAPSCFNEQPWRFLWARRAEDRLPFLSLLVESNRAWAREAPILLFVVSRRTFTRNDKDNRYAGFDTGAAWMSFALQARQLGLYTHAMGGFDYERSFEVLGLDPARWDVHAAVAVGYAADPASLDEETRARERPNSRRPRSEIAFEGRLPAEPDPTS